MKVPKGDYTSFRSGAKVRRSEVRPVLPLHTALRYTRRWWTLHPKSRFCSAAVYLIDHPNIGQVIPGAGGARKLRWAAKGKGKRGGARIVYLYVVIAARIYLLRCYAKSVKTDLTADERKELRQIAAHLKGAQ